VPKSTGRSIERVDGTEITEALRGARRCIVDCHSKTGTIHPRAAVCDERTDHFIIRQTQRLPMRCSATADEKGREQNKQESGN
jgi:hypothetical protein